MTNAARAGGRSTGPGLTAQTLSERAGVNADFIDRLLELGVLSPKAGMFTTTDIRRVRLIHSLEAGGLPLEAMAEALRRGKFSLDFVEAPAYDRIAALTDLSFRQLSEQTKVPLEILLTLREAMGSSQPDPDDHVRENELEVVPALAVQIRYGIRPAVVERSLRTMGESLGRIAEVEGDWWRTDVIMPVFQRGGGPADVARETMGFANELATLTDRALVGLYHGRQSIAWMKNILEGFEQVLATAGLHHATEHPPAICFLDLSGYTRLTEEHGDQAAADLAARLARLVQRTSGEHGGRPIKWLGDGVMFHFREPGPGVLAALEMVEGALAADLPAAHVGLHAGPVIFQEGDYFGRTVNVAARIADYARRGEVLVSQEVVQAVGGAPVTFDPIGPVELKGLTEAVSLHVARRAG
jgi:adenylate cyclase